MDRVDPRGAVVRVNGRGGIQGRCSLRAWGQGLPGCVTLLAERRTHMLGAPARCAITIPSHLSNLAAHTGQFGLQHLGYGCSLQSTRPRFTSNPPVRGNSAKLPFVLGLHAACIPMYPACHAHFSTDFLLPVKDPSEDWTVEYARSTYEKAITAVGSHFTQVQVLVPPAVVNATIGGLRGKTPAHNHPCGSVSSGMQS